MVIKSVPVTVWARGLEGFPNVFHHPIILDGKACAKHHLQLSPRKHVAPRVVVDVKFVPWVMADLIIMKIYSK
jgi:hypothetical protein